MALGIPTRQLVRTVRTWARDESQEPEPNVALCNNSEVAELHLVPVDSLYLNELSDPLIIIMKHSSM